MIPHDRRMRLLPRDGEPVEFLERVSQAFVRGLAFLPIYTAVVVTLTLLVALLMWGTR